MNFAPIDICFLIIVIIFALSALAKGFIKELFGKVSVIGGLALSIIFTPKLNFYISQSISNQIVSKVLSFLLIFICVFLVINIIQHIISKIFSGEIMRGLDRTLGFALGVVEGLVVVTFIITILVIQPWFDVTAIINESRFFAILSGVVDSSSKYLNGMNA